MTGSTNILTILVVLQLLFFAQSKLFTTIYVRFGSNVGSRVQQNIIGHLSKVQNITIIDLTILPDITHVFSDSTNNSKNLSFTQLSQSLLLLIGNSTELLHIIPNEELYAMEPESYIIMSSDFYEIPTLACNGSPLDAHRNTNISFSKDTIHYGAVLSSFVCLEKLGFGFIHPLDFYVPHQLYFNPQSPCTTYSTKILPASSSRAISTSPAISSKSTSSKTKVSATTTTIINTTTIIPSIFSDFCLFKEKESPYWPERSFHIHTQHPLELTEVLQGHDIPQFGPVGPHCAEIWSSRTQMKRGNSVFAPAAAVLHTSKTIRNATIPSTKQPSPSASTTRGSSSGSHSSRHHHHTVYCERWEDMVTDVDLMFQWAIANRLNKIEWLLLGNYKWGDELETRKKRLRVLTMIAHDYSLMVGADCPIGNIQQHAWSMVDMHLPLASQLKQIRDRIDWVFDANFDFITTESGLSEFTHPECELMLSLINEFASYANGTWGREAGIKVHCSTGQKCDSNSKFLHPQTNTSINFNFLPLFATSQLGVFPHTVQVYALDDLTAGAYGNDNFSYIEDYMVYEAKQKKRSVMFYGETAYWVNVDIDVPLFLPLYGQRRLHDLRRIAGRELKEDFRIDGQMNFDSGWEWGYWLSDVITARTSWNPLLHDKMRAYGEYKHHHQQYQAEMIINESDGGSYCDIHNNNSYATNGRVTTTSNNTYSYDQDFINTYSERDDEWLAFSQSLLPITSLFGPTLGPKINALLVKLTQKQAQLMIKGEIQEGIPSSNIKKLSGMAYLSGNDPWIDLPRLMGLPLLQPNKVNIKDSGNDVDWSNALLLLKTMKEEFAVLSVEMRILYDEAEIMSLSYLQSHCNADDTSNNTSNNNTNHNSSSSVCAAYKLHQQQHGYFFVLNDAAMMILTEFNDCFQMLALRSKQVYALYLSRDPVESPSDSDKATLQRKSRGYINQAAAIVANREQHYRVPWERVAAWRENPTVYRFGYLWAVHSLYYWWRDQGLAEQGSLQSELSPCYLNRIDVTETAVGWGKYMFELLRTFINNYSPFTRGYPLELINCIAPPAKEYIFPKDLYPYE